MSRFNKKGYKSIRATNPKTGGVITVPIPIGGILDTKRDELIKKELKKQHDSNRNYKDRLRELKKTYPVEMRSKVNWAEEMKGIL
jgi:hypothetical protein